MSVILIVDDDADLRESLRVVLESKSYRVILVGSGAEGLKAARLHKPDLIMLDVMMETGDSGFEVARELKNDENCKNIPILMRTAVKEKTGFGFEKEAGDPDWLPVDDYCDKALGINDLLAKIEALLKKKR